MNPFATQVPRALLLATAVAFSAGCAAKVKYIDPQSNEGIATVDSVDFQDWDRAASASINSLLRSNALDRADGRRPVIMISRIRNATNEHIDTDLLTKKIRVALNESGKAFTTTAVGVAGPEDEASMGVRQLRESAEFDQSTVQGQGQLKAPDFSLSGKIIELRTRAGSTRQSAFAFQLSLTDLKTGLALWEKEETIVKQGKRASVGW